MLLFFVLSLSLVGCSGEPEQFEGSIRYEVRIDGTSEPSQLKQLMPEAFTYEFKGENVRVLTEGGLLGKLMPDVIYMNNGEQVWAIDTANATATQLDLPPNPAQEAGPVKVERTDSTREIHGYTCYLYLATDTMPEARRFNRIWATPDIKAPTLGENSVQNIGSMRLLEQIEGFPLVIKERVESPSGVLEVNMIAAAVSPEDVPKTRVEVPGDYDTQQMGLQEFQVFRLKQLGFPMGPDAQQGAPGQPQQRPDQQAPPQQAPPQPPAQ
ncbi:MAG: hypothetical protein ACOCZ8_01765 [Bacteroidota bacterium]